MNSPECMALKHKIDTELDWTDIDPKTKETLRKLLKLIVEFADQQGQK